MGVEGGLDDSPRQLPLTAPAEAADEAAKGVAGMGQLTIRRSSRWSRHEATDSTLLFSGDGIYPRNTDARYIDSEV